MSDKSLSRRSNASILFSSTSRKHIGCQHDAILVPHYPSARLLAAQRPGPRRAARRCPGAGRRRRAGPARSSHHGRPHRRHRPRRHRAREASTWTGARCGPASSMGMCIWTRRRPGRASPTRTAPIPAPRTPSSPIARTHYSETDIEPRFDFGLRCALAHGTAAIRTHLDSYWPNAKAHWAVFRRLRDAWAGRIDLQAVSICPLERFAGDDGVALADEVADSGGILGMTTTGEGGQAASPNSRPCSTASSPWPRNAAWRSICTSTRPATRRPAPSTPSPAPRSGEDSARRSRSATSARCLSRQKTRQWRRSRCCAEAGLSVINLPMCNMYLQGRSHRPHPALARHHHGARIPRRRRAGFLRLRQLPGPVLRLRRLRHDGGVSGGRAHRPARPPVRRLGRLGHRHARRACGFRSEAASPSARPPT